MSHVQFDVDSLRRAGAGLIESADDLAARTQSVVAECGDLTVLGTNDTLGSVAQLLHAAVLQRVQETVDSLTSATGDHGKLLQAAGDAYSETETVNTQLGSGISAARDTDGPFCPSGVVVMAIMLPPEVSYALNMIGFEWPEGNEDTVLAWSRRWSAYAGEVNDAAGLAEQAATHALNHNSGAAMDAFSAAWSQTHGAAAVAHDLGTAGHVLGGCLLVVGLAILVLKVAFVISLILLAIQIVQAIAAAAASFGASLAWIPIAREIARRLIELAINLAVNALMGGG